MSAVAPPASRGRWWVLAAYALLAASTQLLWLTFAPIDTSVARALHVDVGLVGDLAAVFPFVYIVLALPTGRWLDARFEQALGVGAVLTGLGAAVRLVDPGSFPWQLAGQLVIAAGQPLVLNSITKTAARHFPPGRRATAVSVGSVALFAGILAAVLAGGPLFAAGGLRLLLLAEGVPSVAAAVLMLVALRARPVYLDAPAAGGRLRDLLRDRLIWKLAALVFLGMGVYNAVATWLEPLLDHYREGASAGALIAVMTFAGVVGAAVLPSLVAQGGRRRAMLLAALAVAAASFGALVLRQDVIWAGAWLAAQGFLTMAALPVVLSWSELHVGIERAGAAAGLLLMMGNLGGLVLVLLVQPAIGSPRLALGLLAVVCAAGLPIAAALPRAAVPEPAVSRG